MMRERERRHNESRLRRQAERGGAGQCTSHSRSRSRRDPSPVHGISVRVLRVQYLRTKCGRGEHREIHGRACNPDCGISPLFRDTRWPIAGPAVGA